MYITVYAFFCVIEVRLLLLLPTNYLFFVMSQRVQLTLLGLFLFLAAVFAICKIHLNISKKYESSFMLYF